jgi:hypothetical protein
MAQSVVELVAFDRIGPDAYETRHNPVRMGNAADIAYGACRKKLVSQCHVITHCTT